MSQNRDNFRANQPPSKVLHVRNLPPDGTEADVLELCRPFGRMLRIKLTGAGTPKNQAFVEFENLRSAIQMITYFVGNTDPPRVKEKTVFLQYSTRQDLGGGMLVSDIKVAAVIGPVLLVTFTCMNAASGPTLEHIHTMFSSFGEVAKIAMTEPPQGGLQALVQFAEVKAATEAKDGMDNSPVPSYMVPNSPTPVMMRVAHSPHQDLALRYQSARAKDYTNPYLPFETAQPSAAELAAAAAEKAALEGSGESAVLLAMIDEVQYAPTVEAMSQVFSVYGPLAKMSIMNRAGMWQALVQYRDAKAAAAAKQYLDGFAMYPGGANKIQLEFSMQRDLHVPQDDEYGWDWTRAEVAAAAAAAAAATAAAAPPSGSGAAAATGQQAAAGRAAGGPGAAVGAAQAEEAGDAERVTGEDYVQAHEEVARLAAGVLRRGGDGGSGGGAA